MDFTFNSLYEIQSREPDEDIFIGRAFNSLYEIPRIYNRALSSYEISAFNSLYEIPSKPLGYCTISNVCFQFSL